MCLYRYIFLLVELGIVVRSSFCIMIFAPEQNSDLKLEVRKDI